MQWGQKPVGSSLLTHAPLFLDPDWPRPPALPPPFALPPPDCVDVGRHPRLRDAAGRGHRLQHDAAVQLCPGAGCSPLVGPVLLDCWAGTLAVQARADCWTGAGHVCELRLYVTPCRLQACACGDAGAALISPFVGRILDWHKKAHNRDYTPEEVGWAELVGNLQCGFNVAEHHGPWHGQAAALLDVPSVLLIHTPSILSHTLATPHPLAVPVRRTRVWPA